MATRRLLIAGTLGAALLALFGAAVTSDARATTTPGVVYVVKVTLTDKSIVIPKDKFSLHSPYPRYPRGAEIRYSITNKGTRPYSLKMWGSTTTVMKAHGGHDSILLNWWERGQFPYTTLYRGKPAGPHGFVTIF
jgi:hypothetical protein